MIFQGAAAPCGAIGVADTRLPPLRGCAPQRPPRSPLAGSGAAPRLNSYRTKHAFHAGFSEMGDGPHFELCGHWQNVSSGSIDNVMGSKGHCPLAGFGAEPRLNRYRTTCFPCRLWRNGEGLHFDLCGHWQNVSSGSIDNVMGSKGHCPLAGSGAEPRKSH